MLASVLGADTPPALGLAMPAIGMSLAFALAIASPFLEELAFRAWMLPLAERAVGMVPGALISSAAYAVAQAPASPLEAGIHFLQGGLYAALFLRTRSLLACAAAHGASSAVALFVSRRLRKG